MKKTVLINSILLFVLIFFLGCKSEENNTNENDTDNLTAVDTSFTEITVDTVISVDSVETDTKIEKIRTKYICPLGDPEGNKNEPGICPVCEMELIENPDYKINNSK